MQDETKKNHDEDEELEYYLVTLEDEAGVEHTFAIVDEVDHENEHYMALVPHNDGSEQTLEEDAELLIFRTAEDNGEEVLDIVEDADELYEIGQVFSARLAEAFDVNLDDLLEDKED